MLRRDNAATIAVGSFGSRVNTFGKTRRAQQHFANSRNFDNVYANGNNHDGSGTNPSWVLLARK